MTSFAVIMTTFPVAMLFRFVYLINPPQLYTGIRKEMFIGHAPGELWEVGRRTCYR